MVRTVLRIASSEKVDEDVPAEDHVRGGEWFHLLGVHEIDNIPAHAATQRLDGAAGVSFRNEILGAERRRQLPKTIARRTAQPSPVRAWRSCRPSRQSRWGICPTIRPLTARSRCSPALLRCRQAALQIRSGRSGWAAKYAGAITRGERLDLIGLTPEERLRHRQPIHQRGPNACPRRRRSGANSSSRETTSGRWRRPARTACRRASRASADRTRRPVR